MPWCGVYQGAEDMSTGTSLMRSLPAATAASVSHGIRVTLNALWRPRTLSTATAPPRTSRYQRRTWGSGGPSASCSTPAPACTPCCPLRGSAGPQCLQQRLELAITDDAATHCARKLWWDHGSPEPGQCMRPQHDVLISRQGHEFTLCTHSDACYTRM